MPIARPLLKYDPLKTRITTPGGDLPASRITDPTPITLSVLLFCVRINVYSPLFFLACALHAELSSSFLISQM